ncbi:MAG: hypothetical protein Q7V43_34985, partial [Myxococcales bacterium]|nr:hypothetical protein [Myxococcales bacterium]
CVVGGCRAGFGDCNGMAADGCEVNVRGSNVNHCGGCGVVCRFPNAAATCATGVCALGACNAGFADCDGNPANGCEVNLNTDNANCGRCSVTGNPATCAAGQVCTSGVCAVSCGAGLTLCAGACTLTSFDPNHCGGCGMRCAIPNVAAQACAGGTCVRGTCANGFADCNGQLPDGCEASVGASCTAGVGACLRSGVVACNNGGTACTAVAAAPGAETCNGMDDDCDGMTDEAITRSCYTGPSGTSGVGLCRAGTQTCVAGGFGACAGEIVPVTEVCSNNTDDDCDGMVDEGCQGTGLSCASPLIVTATTTFARNTCDSTDHGSDTSCGTTGSPDHVYVVRLARRSTVSFQVTGFLSGGNEGDVLYRGSTCPGAPLSCTQHNTNLSLTLEAGDHYYFIEDDHAACQAYSVVITVL